MNTDDATLLPPIQVEPTSAPFELPVTHKTCPDCARGIAAPGITYPRDPLRPVEEFFAQNPDREKKRVQQWHQDHQAQHAETALKSYHRRRGRRGRGT